MSNLANSVVCRSVEQANASCKEEVLLPFRYLHTLIQTSHFSTCNSLLLLCLLCTSGRYKDGEPYRSVVRLDVFVVEAQKVVCPVEWTVWKVSEVGERCGTGGVGCVVVSEEREIGLHGPVSNDHT